MDKRIEEFAANVEKEVKRLVEYVDKEVVPAARKESHLALRSIAKELDKLADKLNDTPKT